MKNRKLMLVPIAVLSLGAVIGCNSNGSSTKTDDFACEEIDNLLKLPEKMESLDYYQALDIAKSAKEGFDSLVGVQSNRFEKTLFSKIYGSAGKLVKDKALNYEIQTNYYSNAVATVSTKKHDIEIENGISNEYNSSRLDTIFYDSNGIAKDNIETYEPASYGETPIQDNISVLGISQEYDPSRQSTAIINFMKSYDLPKLGNDGNDTDLGYFFKQNDNNAYCVKLNSEYSTIENIIDPSKKIVVDTETKIVMHFEKDNNSQWHSKSFANEINTYYDRDLANNIFDTPVLVKSEKYGSKAMYGIISEYSLEVKPFDNILAPTSNMNAYLPSDGRSEEQQENCKDNLNTFDVSDVSRFAYDENNYVYTVIDGEGKVGPQRAVIGTVIGAISSKVKIAYNMYDPLCLVNSLYNDNYITQRNSYLENQSVFLSQNRRYNLDFEFNSTEEIAWSIDSADAEWSKEEQCVKVNKTGMHTVIVYASKKLNAENKREVKLYIKRVGDAEEELIEKRENNYYSVNLNEIPSSNVQYVGEIRTFDMDNGGSELDRIEVSPGFTYNLLNNSGRKQQMVLKAPDKDHIIDISDISVDDELYKNVDSEMTYDKEFAIKIPEQNDVFNPLNISLGRIYDTREYSIVEKELYYTYEEGTGTSMYNKERPQIYNPSSQEFIRLAKNQSEILKGYSYQLKFVNNSVKKDNVIRLRMTTSNIKAPKQLYIKESKNHTSITITRKEYEANQYSIFEITYKNLNDLHFFDNDLPADYHLNMSCDGH